MAPHRGHIFDSQRTAEPPYIREPLPIQASTWSRWVRPVSSGTAGGYFDYGGGSGGNGDGGSMAGSLLSASALDEVFGSYSQTYNYSSGAEKGTLRWGRRRRTLWTLFTEDPWVPGVIRIAMFGLSCVTLGLGGRLTALNVQLPPQPLDAGNSSPSSSSSEGGYGDVPVCDASPAMAVALAALAIVYLPYIFYDEYFGAPVGVRSPLSKARLLFFDLGFVVLYTVNVTLAGDEAFSYGCTNQYMLERAVFGSILVTIVAWIGTFSITLVRLIARMGAGYVTGRD